jgi:Fur family ferric uptake transcriptional regulator
MPLQSSKSDNFEWFWRKLDAYLRAQDLKQTKQRRVIVERLISLNSHIDAETLHNNLKKDHSNIGLATIYRTLNLLKSAGLLEEQTFSDGRSLYEIDHPDTHHDHLVCSDCGRIVEFENEMIESLQRQIAKEHGFELRSHRLDLFGSCVTKNCAYRKSAL